MLQCAHPPLCPAPLTRLLPHAAPRSGIWWGAYGAYTQLLWSLVRGSREGKAPPPGTGEVMAVQTTASVMAGCTSGLLTTPLDLIKVGRPGRATQRAEGSRTRQSLPRCRPAPAQRCACCLAQAAGRKAHTVDLRHALVDLCSSAPGLPQTRIQVAYKHDGAALRFSEVARSILREEGPSGFLRGVVPRMINASLWGTCMVGRRQCRKHNETRLAAVCHLVMGCVCAHRFPPTCLQVSVYELLKRLCALPEPLAAAE
jgi:hypothetical protein